MLTTAGLCVVYWNRETGNVWVEHGDGTASVLIASGVGREVDACDALAGHGLSRRGNFLLTPGQPHVRQVTATQTPAA